MKRETRVALLVGMVFIALFGLVLGRRSLKIASASRQRETEQIANTPAEPGPELERASVDERAERLALESRRRHVRPERAERPERTRRQTPPPREEICRPPAERPSEPSERPPPAPPVEPRRVQPRTYKVRSGDNLTRIAKTVYGRAHGDEYKRIYEANRDKLSGPNSVTVGQELVIPPLPSSPPALRLAVAPQRRGPRVVEMTLEALDERFRNGETYVVQSDDTLTRIARRRMGGGSRATVRKLLRANRDLISDPDRLTVGMRLRIPR